MNTEHPNWGGQRKGAGRPATGRGKSLTIRLSREAYDILDKQPNKSKYIEQLIIQSNV